MRHQVAWRLGLAQLLIVTAAAAVDTPAPAPPIPNARTPMEGVLTGGQPTLENLEQAARSGWRTVINLRADAEPGFEWEAAAAERLGLFYVRIPVASVAGLTRANVERLDAALRTGRERGGVMLHCASGNRVGALLALRAGWLYGATPRAALAIGRAAGLSSLEAATGALLGVGEPADQEPQPLEEPTGRPKPDDGGQRELAQFCVL